MIPQGPFTNDLIGLLAWANRHRLLAWFIKIIHFTHWGVL